MNLIGIHILKSNMTHVEASYAPDEMIKHSEKFYCPENSGEILDEMGKHCSSLVCQETEVFHCLLSFWKKLK